MKYVDTSVLVSLLTEETTSNDAIAWIGRQPQSSIALSGWTLIELSSALTRKVRMSRLLPDQRDAILRHFDARLKPVFVFVTISDTAMREAQQIADFHEWGIRAGDALHLALASENGMSLATFDKQLAKGATTLGYDIELLA
jgi:predicted nucleic acid-binding protein